MKITHSIHITPSTYDKLFELPCVSSVVQTDSLRRSVTVCLVPSLTEGRLRAYTGDWLVEYESGMWQCFGAEAYQRLAIKQ